MAGEQSGSGFEEATAEEREMVCIHIPEVSHGRYMHKVPDCLRRVESNKGEYDPVVASFGPYHHGKEELKLVEDFKPEALRIFTRGSVEMSDYLHNKVLEVVTQLRGCYFDKSTDKFNDYYFASMMLKDASLLIGVLFYPRGVGGSLFGSLGGLVCVRIIRDTYLVENQIPFWLLTFLMDYKFGETAEAMIRRRLSLSVCGEAKLVWRWEHQPLHLLDAHRKLLIPNAQKPNVEKRHCLWKKKRSDENDDNFRKYIHSFRSATDMKAKGIHFRPSPTPFFKDINFKSYSLFAVLRLPTWIFTSQSKVFFLNMVAFELCPGNKKDLTVSTYLNFLRSLVQSPQDVKELREKRIFFNLLGSDEEVFKVLGDINTYGLHDVDLFKESMDKIEKHFSSKQNTWLGELISSYFKSPWAIIALLAAVLLLCLTFLQTYYTINNPSSNKAT